MSIRKREWTSGGDTKTAWVVVQDRVPAAGSRKGVEFTHIFGSDSPRSREAASSFPSPSSALSPRPSVKPFKN